MAGFFDSFLADTARCINENFEPGAVLEVKHLRKLMVIDSTDRSFIIFSSRALQRLSDLGYLELLGNASPKRFRKIGQIPIDNLE